jgi:hypothetical protein
VTCSLRSARCCVITAVAAVLLNCCAAMLLCCWLITDAFFDASVAASCALFSPWFDVVRWFV